VLVADFAIVIAMAIVETCLAHAALHGARTDSTQTRTKSCHRTGKHTEVQRGVEVQSCSTAPANGF
jgi:hypothetical protein